VDGSPLNGEALTAARAVVRNSFIQGTLSIVFVVMVGTLAVCALVQIVRALRGRPRASEDPYQESNFYAPSHFIAKPIERMAEIEYASVGDPALIPERQRR
jgi:carbon starvation protein